MLKPFPLDQVNALSKGTLMETLGIEFTEVGERHLCARMPVDFRHHQPMGLLHGGASVALAESVGSAASALILGRGEFAPVGQSINASHVRPVTSGWVYARAEAEHIGKRSHLWVIRITDEENKLVCHCRLTMAIIKTNL